MVTTTEGKLEETLLKRDGHWKPPRIGVAETIDQSAAMVDRFHRLFLRTLRALREHRRHAPQVVVQNAAQVNVGAVQQNVAADPHCARASGVSGGGERENRVLTTPGRETERGD